MPPESPDPFEQLLRSHRRLEERLEDLRRAAADLDGPNHVEARAYIDDSVRWLERSVGRHELDEEQSLFPRLRAHVGLVGLLDKLEREHREHERLHQALRDSAGKPAAEVSAVVRELAAAYRVHIDDEERELFPAARPLLDEAARAAMLAEMDARRGR